MFKSSRKTPRKIRTSKLEKIKEITLGDISQPKNQRPISEINVRNLMQSIKVAGLQNPITVVKTENGFRLVAGGHRLEACRRLGHTRILVKILCKKQSKDFSAF